MLISAIVTLSSIASALTLLLLSLRILLSCVKGALLINFASKCGINIASLFSYDCEESSNVDWLGFLVKFRSQTIACPY